MNFVFGVLAVLGIISIIGWLAFNIWQRTEGFTAKARKVLPIAGGVILVLFLLSSMVVQIEAGEVGVIKRFGKVTGGSLEPGLHFVIPVSDRVLVYNTKQTVYETGDNPQSSNADYTDVAVNTMTNDGQRITVRFTVKFHIDNTKVGWIAQNIGDANAVVEKVVKATARSEGRNIPKLFSAEDLYSDKVYDAQAEFAKRVAPAFEKNGVVLDEFLLRDIGFDEDLADALERKQIALEDQITASRIVDVKSAEASQTIATAKGEAQANIERGRGEAERIRLVNTQLANAPWYNQYILNKGIADGTTNIEWAMVPSGSQPLVDFRKPQGAEK